MLTYELIIKYLTPDKNPFLLKSNNFFNFTFFDDNFYYINVDKYSFNNSVSYCLDTIINDSIDFVNELNINIIIFDFKNNNIYCDYNGEYFNPWKPTIFLANYNEWWAPIISKETRIFSFCSPHSNILKQYILIQNIIKNKTKEPIIINDNFNEIIELEGFNNSSDNFIIIEKPPKAKLDKMKKDELLQLCKELNKEILISKPTKKDLIEIICKD
jgi:hypothetical protein